MRFSTNITLLVASAVGTQAGLLAYGVCQGGCAAIVVPCYAGAGFTFGTVLAAAAPPAILACDAAFGTCQAACAAVALTPTP